MSKRRVAAFDLDATLHRGTREGESLGQAVVRQLIKEGKAKDMFAKADPHFHAYDRREGNYEAFITAMDVNLVNGFFAGLNREEVYAISHKIVERELKRTYVFTRELLRACQACGYYTVAISGSYYGIARKFAEGWGFDAVYGSELEADEQGHYYGTPDRMTINARMKGDVLHRVAKEQGLTLEGSIAVGDTIGDASMLEVAEYPILFNASNDLLEHFERRGRQSLLAVEKRVLYLVPWGKKNRRIADLPGDVYGSLHQRLDAAGMNVRYL